MSDVTSDNPSLDLREQLVRIDRMIAETHKLQEESNKFSAETRKLGRERWLAPIVVAASFVGAVGGATVALFTVLRGWHG